MPDQDVISVKLERCENGFIMTHTTDGEQARKRVLESKTDAEVLYHIGSAFELKGALIMEEVPVGGGEPKSYMLV